MKSRAIELGVRAVLRLHWMLVRGLRAVRPVRPPARGRCRILLTGSFQSPAWVEHHLVPLCRSDYCAGVTMVATDAVPDIAGLRVIRPPAWLTGVTGSAAARLIVLAAVALRTRPDIVGGFHLLFNGLAAAAIAAAVGARSLYFCVGGPMEIVDGGIWAENKLLDRMGRPSPAIERGLARAIGRFDLLVAMGTRAAAFLRDRGARGAIHVIPGGLDAAAFAAAAWPPERDLIFVGRLAPIKRLDLLLGAVALLKRRMPQVSLAVVGDGVLMGTLQARAAQLGIADNVTFAGHRREVAEWVRGSRAFVLVSDTEGVSLSLMEAFACGVPAVVSAVGDLADVVEDGVNGYLVAERTPEAIAARLFELLADERRRQQFAARARATADRFAADAMVRRWDALLGDPLTARQPVGDLGHDARAGVPVP
jgi:glycosyltransferase involved in cell wall biosynthesis